MEWAKKDRGQSAKPRHGVYAVGFNDLTDLARESVFHCSLRVPKNSLIAAFTGSEWVMLTA